MRKYFSFVKFISLIVIFAPFSAQAENYCFHPNTGLFEEDGNTKKINWEMTILKSRNSGNKENCFLEYVFSGGLNSPIEIIKKPKNIKAYIEGWAKVIVIPDKVLVDHMTIKITYIKKNTGKITTGFVDYTITIKDAPL